MPVRKFRTVEAMNRARERERALRGVDWRAIAEVLEIADAGAPRHLEPGVYKHRTVESWNAQSERWEAESIERARTAAKARA